MPPACPNCGAPADARDLRGGVTVGPCRHCGAAVPVAGAASGPGVVPVTPEDRRRRAETARLGARVVGGLWVAMTLPFALLAVLMAGAVWWVTGEMGLPTPGRALAAAVPLVMGLGALGTTLAMAWGARAVVDRATEEGPGGEADR